MGEKEIQSVVEYLEHLYLDEVLGCFDLHITFYNRVTLGLLVKWYTASSEVTGTAQYEVSSRTGLHGAHSHPLKSTTTLSCTACNASIYDKT